MNGLNAPALEHQWINGSVVEVSALSDSTLNLVQKMALADAELAIIQQPAT